MCWLSATAAVGNREVHPGGGGGGCRREVLGGIALLGGGNAALTERLPLELIEVRLKAWGGGVLLRGKGTGGNRLYFDIPLVWCASTSGQRDRMCWQSELCPSICVSVGGSASRGGSAQGGGIRRWEDNSTGGRDSAFGVSRINAARSSLLTENGIGISDPLVAM